MTINLGSAATLYGQLIATTEGYVGDMPIIHQAAAEEATVDAMDTVFAEGYFCRTLSPTAQPN